MKVKYADGSTIIVGTVDGYSAVANNTGNALKVKSSQRHGQSALQKEMSAILVSVARSWKPQTAAVKQNWKTYVATFPQPQHRNPEKSLSAYCNFLKRNFYQLLYQGTSYVPVTDPVLVQFLAESVSIVTTVSSTSLILDLTFERNSDEFDVIIFVSPVKSKGLNWFDNSTRLATMVSNVNQSVDITASFLSRFAQLPPPTAHLFFKAIFIGRTNGQFSFYQKTIIIPKLPHPPFALIKNGLLYSKEAVISSLNIAPPGWRIPSIADFENLIVQAGGSLAAGNHLKEVSSEFWVDQNANDNNLTIYTARGSGLKNSFSGFQNLQRQSYHAVSDDGMQYYQAVLSLINSFASAEVGAVDRFAGVSVRLIKNDSIDPGYVVGNDGKCYETVKIGSQVFTKHNIAETRYGDGSTIQFASNETEWNNGLSAMSCAYNFDESNV